MKALVVYDSVFGNTEKVAQTIGEALAEYGEDEVRKVGSVQPAQLTGLDLLIVGSPTRAFSPTPDTKQFLSSIPAGSLQGVTVAAFDTRIAVEDTNSAILKFFVKIFGYAAKPIATRLERRGGELAVPPEGFIVEGTEGPMKEGELARATQWAKGIANAL
ncbi:MAG: flavodoxin family protein [Anaerolineae bacterium]